jgi:protein gp37
MAQNSNIEWTDTTWNPLSGCTRASVGCDNCYAAKMSLRLEAMALADIASGKDPGGKAKYIGIASKNGRGIPAFNGTINLDEDELQRPYSWKKPRRVFVNSMSDLFHEDVPEWFILSAFNVMRDNPKHIFQVLTKRPGRAADFTNRLPFVPKNVWIGTSVENQEQADRRIPELINVPATVRFLSMEPLLGPVDIDEYLTYEWGENHGGMFGDFTETNVHWVIVGGESGHGKRPFNPDWARSIRDQCHAAGVPFFMKQWDKVQAIPEDLMIREFPIVQANETR